MLKQKYLQIIYKNQDFLDFYPRNRRRIRFLNSNDASGFWGGERLKLC